MRQSIADKIRRQNKRIQKRDLTQHEIRLMYHHKMLTIAETVEALTQIQRSAINAKDNPFR